MTIFAVMAWDYAVERSLDLGAWDHSVLRIFVRLGMTLGPLLLFRPRQPQDDGVFDYEEEL
jgi:hypothetical protein